MAVLQVIEDTKLNPSNKSVDEFDFSGQMVRIFTVDFSEDVDPVAQQTLAVDPGIIDPNTGVYVPILWESHPYDPWAFVIDKKQDAGKGANVRIVTVTYERRRNPLEIAPVISWGFATSAEAIDRDNQGKPITNSADETPDPPFVEDFSEIVMRIAVNWAKFEPLLAADYMNAVNSDFFYGFPPKTCKLMIFDGEPVRAAELYYYAVTIEIHIRYDVENELLSGWQKRFMDEGFRVIKRDDNGNILHDDDVVDGEGNVTTRGKKIAYEILTGDDKVTPLSQPVKLDGEGGKLEEGKDPVFLEYETFKLRPFDVLGIR
jgi:hypothetical protein